MISPWRPDYGLNNTAKRTTEKSLLCAYISALVVIKQMRKYRAPPTTQVVPKSLAKFCTYRCDLQIENCKCKWTLFLWLLSRDCLLFLYIHALSIMELNCSAKHRKCGGDNNNNQKIMCRGIHLNKWESVVVIVWRSVWHIEWHWILKKNLLRAVRKNMLITFFWAKEGGWILISSSFSLFSFCEKIIDIAAKVFYIIQSAGYWENGDSTFPCNESAFPWRRSITIFFFSASFWMFVFVMSRSFYYCKPSNGQDVGKRTTSTARV